MEILLRPQDHFPYTVQPMPGALKPAKMNLPPNFGDIKGRVRWVVLAWQLLLARRWNPVHDECLTHVPAQYLYSSKKMAFELFPL